MCRRSFGELLEWWMERIDERNSLVPTEPSHQRAGGNLRYFEKLLLKEQYEQRDEERTKHPDSEEPIQLGTYVRPKDHLPERETYEALCRGEGGGMVRRDEKSHACDILITWDMHCFSGEEDSAELILKFCSYLLSDSINQV